MRPAATSARRRPRDRGRRHRTGRPTGRGPPDLRALVPREHPRALRSRTRAGLVVLAPTASIAADRRYAVDVTLIDVQQRTEREIEWTSEQLDVIAATEPGAFVSVLGAAGTGKTIIAARRAAGLAAVGLRVVFVADQRYLHSSL